MNSLALLVSFAFALAAEPAQVTVQQVADSTFHVPVEHPAFVDRPLRVVLDEAHHNFHTLGGRYRPFAELLERDGCVLTAGTQTFTTPSLTAFDLLVIANAAGDDIATGTDDSVARPAFTRDEIAAVYAWVQAGGRLLLVADHSPFGEAASELAERFGVDMGRSYTFDTAQALAGQGNPGVIEFARERNTLGDHPILQGRDASERIGRLVAFMGQSLRGPGDSSSFLLLSTNAFDLPPSAQADLDDLEAVKRRARPANGRCMGVALTSGRGRVVVLGESGMLTAQIITEPGGESRRMGMNVPGTDNPQFVLNVVRWLGGVLEGAGPIADFSGSWLIATQETEAWRGQGSIGNFEEPVHIMQTATQLSIEVQSPDPTGRFRYDLTATPRAGSDLGPEEVWSSSVWDGASLLTSGRRLFTTPKGPQPFEFTEERKLLADGDRMLVRTRIKMWPTDLVRSTEYRRAP